MTEEYGFALAAGTKIADYRIESLLGEGGFGLTYLAFDENLHKQVAIKEYLPVDFAMRGGSDSVVPRTQSNKDDFNWGLNAFINEARTLARFHNPNIVQVFRYLEANGTAYIVMEFVAGRTLSDAVTDLGGLNEQEVMSILLPVLDGLAEVHEAGILHRDIKPDNILIRDNGKPVLIDFGAARQALGVKSRSVTTIITPGYAPIEQYSTKGNVGPWSDIYSLAAVAYFCLTLKRPDDASDRVLSDDIEPATKLAENQGRIMFLQAIDRALSVTPQDRPQSLELWVKALSDGGESTVEENVSVDKKVSDEKSNPHSALQSGSSSASGLEQSPLGEKNVVSSAVGEPLGAESPSNRKFILSVLSVVGVLCLGLLSMIWLNPSQTVEVTAPTPTSSPTPVPTPRPTSRSERTPTSQQSEPPPAPQAPIQTSYPLYVQSVPPGADIELVSYGQSYFDGIAMPVGEYKLSVSKTGYKPKQTSVQIVDQAVRATVTLEPVISPQEQADYDKAKRTRQLVDLERYLARYPSGQYAEQVGRWLSDAKQALQARWQNCREVPGKYAGLTGRALFQMPAEMGTDFVIKVGRFKVQPNAIKMVRYADENAVHCASVAGCFEIRGKFGLQSYSVTVGGNTLQGQACFYYLDDKPHLYRADS